MFYFLNVRTNLKYIFPYSTFNICRQLRKKVWIKIKREIDPQNHSANILYKTLSLLSHNTTFDWQMPIFVIRGSKLLEIKKIYKTKYPGNKYFYICVSGVRNEVVKISDKLQPKHFTTWHSLNVRHRLRHSKTKPQSRRQEGEDEKIEESLIVKNRNGFLSSFHVINFYFDVIIILILYEHQGFNC